MMSTKNIQTAAAALGNQLKAGIPLSDATKRMARLQPKEAEFWVAAAKQLSSGHRITDQLKGVWPESLVNAVMAGEESGNLPEVFVRIEQTIEIQMKIQGMIWKLGYPVGLGLAGLGVFVFFMTQVLPALSQSLGSGDHGMVFQLSTWMTATLSQYWVAILSGFLITIFLLIAWLKQPDNRAMILDFFITLPVIGDALINLYFGLWAYYMALMDSAGGIPITTSLEMTSSVLPLSLQAGVKQMASEVVRRGLADAADPEKQKESDPRRNWPFYISNSFIVAQQTGLLDAELMRVAPALLKDGIGKLEKALQFANIIALVISALFIVGPLMAYYMQLGAALQSAMHG